MIDRKDTPAPTMGRPPKRHDSLGSPPHTPAHKVRATGRHVSKPHGSRQTPRETYFGLPNGVNARGGGEQTRKERSERISHDLSLTDHARHSVVDNMLMSLNPNQPALYTAYADEATDSTKANDYQRDQLPPSSVSSEHTPPTDGSFNRHSNQHTRGRRSNSSSNFQSALERIDSIQKKAADSTRAKVYQAQRAGAGDRSSLPPSRSGRKSSKSSGSSSVDFGQMMGPRWQHAIGRRSSSFDHGQSSRGTHTSSSSASMRMPMVQSLSQSRIYDNPDAAPMPFVPVGPHSRDRSPAHPPHPSHAPPQAPMVRRRNSGKSLKSKRDKGELRTLESRAVNVNIAAELRHESQVLPSPAYANPRAASPLSNPHGVLSASAQGSISIPKGQSRDRPGFFKRVFGSSKSNTPVTNDFLTQGPYSHFGEVADAQGGYTIPQRPSQSLPTQPTKENVPPTLVKKPSSFFRRRKKSISEYNPPPVLPLHLYSHYTNDSNDGSADRILETSSSVSSLRKIMTPYLSNSQQDRDGIQAPASTEQNTAESFHDMPGESTIRIPPKRPRATFDSQNSFSSQSQNRDLAHLDRESAKGELNSDDKLHVTHGDSFLNDSSSTETRPVVSANRTEPVMSSATVNRPAAKVQTDIASRNEKENVPPASPKDVQRKRVKGAATATGSPKDSSLKSDAVPQQNVPKRLDSKNWLTPASVTSSRKKTSPPGSSGSSRRVWLEPADSDDEVKKLESLSLPLEGAPTSPVSPISDYHSASSRQPRQRLSIGDDGAVSPIQPSPNVTSPAIDLSVPTEDDRILARQVYDGDESLVTHVKAAGWLGDSGPERLRVRHAYMELFQWQNLNILTALRDLCNKLLLKGETQQVDRILDAFSARWSTCNLNHGFKATGTFLKGDLHIIN